MRFGFKISSSSLILIPTLLVFIQENNVCMQSLKGSSHASFPDLQEEDYVGYSDNECVENPNLTPPEAISVS